MAFKHNGPLLTLYPGTLLQCLVQNMWPVLEKFIKEMDAMSGSWLESPPFPTYPN